MHFPQPISPAGLVEPCARRVRAILDDVTLCDTTRALYLWEWEFYPQFQIPVADFTPGVLRDNGEPHNLRFGSAVAVDLVAGDEVRERVGRRYVSSSIEGLVDTVHLDWTGPQVWMEEDERVFVHPRSPYVRVDAVRSRRRVRVSRDGVLLADSDAVVMVFETGLPTRYYMDRTAVDFTHLRPTPTVTECPYKGRTTDYWSAVIGDETYEDLAWSYAFTTPALTAIEGLVAFYDELVDVEIDGVAQPRAESHLAG